jgi:hypothetical protein
VNGEVATAPALTGSSIIADTDVFGDAANGIGSRS